MELFLYSNISNTIYKLYDIHCETTQPHFSIDIDIWEVIYEYCAV